MNKLPLMVLSLCAISATGYCNAAAANNLVLEKIITVTRHGVRSQSNSASVQENSPTPIPVFSSKDGELTMHGYAAVTRMGDYLRRYYAHQNFVTEKACTDPKGIFIRTSAFQRTRMTARALADSLFPGCAVPIHSPENKTQDTLFEPIVSGMAPLDINKAQKSVMAALGGDFAAARQRYARQIAAMQAVVDPNCQPDRCTFTNHEWRISPDKQNINISLQGPIARGNELGETFRLQYAEGMPLKDVAFNHITSATDIAPLMELKDIKFDLIEHNPYIAARGGSQLMSQILYALEKDSGFQDPDADAQISASAPNARMVMYVAHDTNLGYLQQLLKVSWRLEGYPQDDTPPGSTLLFERYRDSKTRQAFIGVTFITQTLDQIRRLEPLGNKNLPLQRRLNLHCKTSLNDWLCPINEFAAQINSRLDRSAIIAQRDAIQISP